VVYSTALVLPLMTRRSTQPRLSSAVRTSIFLHVGLAVALTAHLFIPGQAHDPLVGIYSGLVYIGFAFVVWAAARRHFAAVSVTYAQFYILAAVIGVAAAWYATGYGDENPLWTMSRLRIREADDIKIFDGSVLPWIRRGATLTDPETNAPLFWYVNVRIQELFPWSGGSSVYASIATNLAVGAACAALSVAAARELIPQEEARAGTAAVWAHRVTVWCPWLLAASAMFLRDIWIYFLIALGLYAGLAVRKASLAKKVLAGLTVIPMLAVGGYLLRQQMAVVCAGVYVAGAFSEMKLRRAVLLGACAVAVALAVGLQLPTAGRDVLEQAAQYAEWGAEGVGGGTIPRLIGDSLLKRGLFYTAWMPVSPLPRIVIDPWSLYSPGKTLTAVWIVAVMAVALGARRGVRQKMDVFGPVLGAWVLVVTVAVAFTSGETRHFYVVIPVVIACAAASVARAARTSIATSPFRRFLSVGGAVLLVSVVLSVAVFGPASLVR
jgi:hypothetical protein